MRFAADESFMVVGDGEFECVDCDYVYVPANGDPDYPLPKGMEFKDLPEDWCCPVCASSVTSNLFQMER